jgi:hypothetical protein
MHNRSNSRVNIMYSTVRSIMGSCSMNLRIVRAMRYDILYGSYDTTYVRRTISVSGLKTGGNRGTTQPEFRLRDPCAPLQCCSGPEPRSGARRPESPVLVTRTRNSGRNKQLSLLVHPPLRWLAASLTLPRRPPL